MLNCFFGFLALRTEVGVVSVSRVNVHTAVSCYHVKDGPVACFVIGQRVVKFVYNG